MAINDLKNDGIYSMVNSLGRGFNVFGPYDMNGLISNRIFDWNKTETYATNPFLGERRTIPKIVSLTPQTQTRFLDIVATTREEVQNKMAAHAKVEASYGPFSGEFQIDYSSEVENSSNYFYAMRKAFVSLGYITLDNNVSAYFADEFARRVAQLPDNVTDANIRQFVEFFQDYGFYYVDRLSIGGELNLIISVATTSNLTRQALSSSLNIAYDGVFKGQLDVSGSFQAQWKTFSENSTIRVRGLGGQADKVAALASIDPKNPNQDVASQVKLWTQTLEFLPAVMDMQFTGIWRLCGTKRDAVEQAFHKFGVTMMPKVSLTSAPNGSTLVIGGKVLHPDNPAQQQDCGYHLAVISRKKVLEVDGIKLNKFYSYNPNVTRGTDRRKIYDQMLNDINLTNLNNRENFIFLCSYNLDHRVFPPYAFYQFLKESGGVMQMD